MAEIDISCKVDTFDLSNNLVGVMSEDEIIAFVLEIEGHIADWDFTRKLRDALNDLLKDEQ